MLEKLRGWWQRKREQWRDAQVPERQVVVRVDEQELSVSHPHGTVQTVSWADIRKVEIHTNDSGPWGTDVWFVIRARSGECIYPQGATGDAQAFEWLQKLPGFDNEEVVRAMACTSKAVFVCWEAEGEISGV